MNFRTKYHIICSLYCDIWLSCLSCATTPHPPRRAPAFLNLHGTKNFDSLTFSPPQIQGFAIRYKLKIVIMILKYFAETNQKVLKHEFLSD